jgi:hypothetical protein
VGAAVIEANLERLGLDESARSHDQLRAAVLVGLSCESDHAIDHVALALAHRLHARGEGARKGAIQLAVAQEVRHLGAPDLVLARQTVDVRAGAADPAALDYRDPVSGARHVPRQESAAIAAAQYQIFILLSHGLPPKQT